jgi:predicted chitinase
MFDSLAPLAQAPYSYSGFCEAITAYNSIHPLEKVFMMGSVEQQRAEIAAFLGNTLHESDKFRAGREYTPCADKKIVNGKVYCKPCDANNFDWDTFTCPASLVSSNRVWDGYCNPGISPPDACSCGPVSGGTGELEGYVEADKLFFGRGAIQLTWNYNYIKASLSLTGSEDTFCNQPDLVATVGKHAWGAGIYFWMESLKGDAASGGAASTSHVQALTGDFGGTLWNINGGLECPGHSDWHKKAVVMRINHYCQAATTLGVSSLLDFAGCAGMQESFGACTAANCPACAVWKQSDGTAYIMGALGIWR